jgi:hypothetical protein
MTRVAPNPFSDDARPPGDHALTLFLGARAGLLAEIWVSVLERGLQPVWVWGGTDWGWAMQTQTLGTPPIVVRAHADDLEAIVSVPADALPSIHASELLSTRAKHRIPLTVRGSDFAYAYIDLIKHDDVDLVLELLDARLRLAHREHTGRMPA